MKNKEYRQCLRNEDFDTHFEKTRTSKGKKDATRPPSHAHRIRKGLDDSQEFKCVQCGSFITSARELSGVNNRNHCPHCLWSKHVDLYHAGDRKAQCQSRMQPIGLTIKQTFKRYGVEKQGELMLIHRCSGCGKLNINRIAADDNAALLYDLFIKSGRLDQRLQDQLEQEGIIPLTFRDLTSVYAQLFGWQPIVEEFHPLENIEPVNVDLADEDATL